MKTGSIGQALLAVASLALGTLSAQANPGHRMHKVDSNGDGVVDFNEMQAVRPELTLEEFNKMDANSDGQLGRDELSEARFARRIKMVDKDGDGAISKDEMEEFHRRPHTGRFERFDSDGDGKLTQAELKSMHEQMAEHGPAFVKFRHGPETGEKESETK